ncbi:MAG: glycine-rich domain-containing protein [bacterium]
MNTQHANANRHTDGIKPGWFSRLNTEHRILNTVFLLTLLLAVFAPRAEATWAKGGTVTNYVENGTNFTAHVFTTVGTNTIEFGGVGTIDYLVVAGGGSGGCIQNNWGSGGGGAGGMLTGSTTVQAQVYAIVVGAGGPAQGQVNPGLPGQVSSFTNSSMTNLVAIGGGYGGSGGGGNGGSGGGGGTFGGAGGTGTAPQGYNGGYCTGGQAGFGGGGGGAGSVGVSNTASINPGYGGTGVYVSAFSRWGDASNLGWFGGGGGGSKGNGTDYGRGGKGGGGNAGQGGTAAISGQANTGGGGGGAGGTSAAGAGGSGIVIVRYVTPSSDPQQWMKITLAGYTNRLETLTNFPVLVVLSNNVGNSGFTYDKFFSTFGTNATAAKRGDDLRFVANLADTNGFPYEIESWNTNGASYIWVQVPTILGDGSGVIWAKWGYPAWIWGTNNPTPVWTNGFTIVAHMPEASGTVYDSTTNKNNGTIANGTANGQLYVRCVDQSIERHDDTDGGRFRHHLRR